MDGDSTLKPDHSSPKALVLGAWGWCALCLLLVALRGVRWDEEFEMAQVVLGHLPYPLAHPLVRATRNALNLQIYLSAAIVTLSPGPTVLCFVRNTFFLLATVLPVYCIAAALGRRALLAHIAAVFVLLAVHEEFDGCKRLVTWPHFFSTGHVGRGYAMLCLAALLAGRWRTGLGMLGLMPCVHIAHMPVVLGFALLRVGAAWRAERRQLTHGLMWCAAGLVVCGVIWVSKGWFTAPEPAASSPYYSTADPAPIWEGFLATDVHRALPGGPVKYGNSFFVLGAALVLAAMAARVEWRRERNWGRWGWALVFVFGCACAVWGIMAIHTALGDDVPYVFIAWMPYRFTNHAATVLLAALPVLLAGQLRTMGWQGWVLAAVPLAYGVVRPVLPMLVPDTLFDTYVAGGAFLLFFLCGAAWTMVWRELHEDPPGKATAIVVTAVALAALASYHQFGALMVVAGAVTAAIVLWLPRKASSPPEARTFAAALLALCMLVIGYRQWHERVVLPISPMDGQIRALAERAPLFLVAQPDQYGLQSRTGCPVMVDGPLAPWIPYMPSLGPSIQKIHHDLYGIRWDGPIERPWTEIWRMRPPDEWQALAEEYGFNAIVAPASVPLTLPAVAHARGISGHEDRLYLIDGSAE